MTQNLINQLNELLPQTQCGLCNYAGCKPYAEALVEKNESIDHCLPGGEKTLIAIAGLLDRSPQPYIDTLRSKTKPPMRAVIQENECIGCTKCISACPVDAIMGGAKQMHAILESECTGCELCVEPCPMDCISMVKLPAAEYVPALARHRYENKNQRLEKLRQAGKSQHQKAKNLAGSEELEKRRRAIKEEIKAALERSKAKRAQR